MACQPRCYWPPCSAAAAWPSGALGGKPAASPSFWTLRKYFWAWLRICNTHYVQSWVSVVGQIQVSTHTHTNVLLFIGSTTSIRENKVPRWRWQMTRKSIYLYQYHLHFTCNPPPCCSNSKSSKLVTWPSIRQGPFICHTRPNHTAQYTNLSLGAKATIANQSTNLSQKPSQRYYLISLKNIICHEQSSTTSKNSRQKLAKHEHIQSYKKSLLLHIQS
jgi:hypothetical protein